MSFNSALSSLLPAGIKKPYANSQVANQVVLFADYSNVAIDFMSLRLKRPNYFRHPQENLLNKCSWALQKNQHDEVVNLDAEVPKEDQVAEGATIRKDVKVYDEEEAL
ncbi:hypothetical protein MIR68_010622 [Amoeboaphelidium protococcarum]|nr:hypothetical protein MIR68_010622 [Amoeboaphelidium protococcarum]